MKKLIFPVLILIGLLGCNDKSNNSKENLEKSLKKNLDLMVEEYHVPGAVLLIKSPQYNGIFTVGKTDLEAGKPITADTLFGIGIITKTL